MIRQIEFQSVIVEGNDLDHAVDQPLSIFLQFQIQVTVAVEGEQDHLFADLTLVLPLMDRILNNLTEDTISGILRFCELLFYSLFLLYIQLIRWHLYSVRLQIPHILRAYINIFVIEWIVFLIYAVHFFIDGKEDIGRY